MTDTPQQQARPVLKRPRPVLSCLECRRKKLKCDRLLPCQQCLKLDQPSLCVYAPGQEPSRRNNAEGSESATKRTRCDTSIESTQDESDQINELNERVRRLEQALRQQQSFPATPNLQERHSTSALSEPSTLQREPLNGSPSTARPESPLFDDNFVLLGKFEDAFTFIQRINQHDRDPAIEAISGQLFAINQATTGPELMQNGTTIAHGDIQTVLRQLLRLVPEPHVCAKLVELYFENFEHCARVLHKSYFMSQHRHYSQRAMHQSQMDYFIPTLIGVLGMASSLHTYPECELPALRGSLTEPSAVQLLDIWYDLVIDRDGPSTAAIQVKLLVMQIQRYQIRDTTKLWVSSAQLIRQAIIQNLHIEPPSTTSNLQADLRRSLWLTILEQDLALAISCGLPPLCPSYDLQPISNCNDDELSDFTIERPPIHPSHQWTDGLCQHILATTFNRRLEAYKHRFAPRSPSHYAKTLEYTASLESILRELPPLFRLDHVSNTPGRLMAQMDLDITLRRPLIAAYAPYATAEPIGNVYQEVRIPWVQSNLVVMCFQDLFDPQYPGIDVPRPIGYWDFYYTAYRHDATQSLKAMLVEASYLRRKEASPENHERAVHENPVGASPAKFMRWNFVAMIKSIEDTLNPMSRRIGPFGGDLDTIIRFFFLYYCLKAPVGVDVRSHVIDGFQDLIQRVRRRLETEGHPVEPYTSIDTVSEGTRNWFITLLGKER